MSNHGKRMTRMGEKFPESKLEQMEIYDINDRDFKITVLKIPNKMRENTDWQFNAL